MTNTWGRYISDWSLYLRSAGTPDTTVNLRVYYVTRCATEVGRTPGSVTFTQLAEWMAAQSWAPNTRKSVRSSLRSFYSWAMASGRVELSPAHLLPPVRIPRQLPKPASEDAYRTALDVIDERIRLGIVLAGNNGLRRGELAHSRREHMERDLHGWSLRVIGKGGHERVVPLLDDVAEVILARPDGWLFPSSQGGHLTPHYLSKLISATLPDGVSTHNLRHRCGTIAYEQTKDLRAVQELLGHARPETTALYTKVSPLSVRRAMETAA